DPVLELRGLAQHVDERLPVLDHQRRFGTRLPATGCDHLSERPLLGARRNVGGVLDRAHDLPSRSGPSNSRGTAVGARTVGSRTGARPASMGSSPGASAESRAAIGPGVGELEGASYLD